MTMTLVENTRPVEAIPPQTGAAGDNGLWYNMQDIARLNILAHIAQGAAPTVDITVEQATDNSGTGGKALATAVPIWANQDAATAATYTRQTDAVSFTTSAALADKLVIFQLDPSALDVANDYTHVRVVLGASDVANIIAAQYIGETRAPADSPPDPLA